MINDSVKVRGSWLAIILEDEDAWRAVAEQVWNFSANASVDLSDRTQLADDYVYWLGRLQL